MKCADSQVAMLVTAAVVAAGIFGCRENAVSPVGSRTALPISTKPGPEESFELILETFRRGIEGVPIGFVMSREGGHSMMVGKNEVSHELIQPAQEGDPYKAIITVNSESRYSIQRSTTRDESGPLEEQSRNQGSQSGIAGADDPVSIDILDSDLVGTPAKGASNRQPTVPVEDTSVNRLPPNEIQRQYELLYRDGRWKLVTKLDKETEQSIENAFEQALKTQI